MKVKRARTHTHVHIILSNVISYRWGTNLTLSFLENITPPESQLHSIHCPEEEYLEFLRLRKDLLALCSEKKKKKKN